LKPTKLVKKNENYQIFAIFFNRFVTICFFLRHLRVGARFRPRAFYHDRLNLSK